MIVWLMILGIFLILLPILLAAIVSFNNNVSIFNEGSGGGAYLLFLVITLPIGLIMSGIGYFF
jgi:hypothetical protein